MTFDRPYSRAVDFETARREIQRSAGTHFDPRVVESFMGVPLTTLEEIRQKSLE
jgi:response regulator RpfG family c-di-GMP phosphodiesterase